MLKVFHTLAVISIMLVLATQATLLHAHAQDQLRAKIREHIRQRISNSQLRNGKISNIADRTRGAEFIHISGLNVAVWTPAHRNHPAPLVVFSHGFSGINVQSAWLMRAIADAGYIVVAPNHKDAIGSGPIDKSKTVPDFLEPLSWTDTSFADRAEDVRNLIDGLKTDPGWKGKIDFARIALVGHSLGGYTVLGLAGGWPSWKIPNVKAVLALSPYAHPFNWNGNLSKMSAPIMYQSGSADVGIAPFLKGKSGAYQITRSPAYLIEIAHANHLSWTNQNRSGEHQELIVHYCVSFLNKYVKGDKTAIPEKRLAGLSEFRTK